VTDAKIGGEMKTNQAATAVSSATALALRLIASSRARLSRHRRLSPPT
jgi:hypothetical protein